MSEQWVGLHNPDRHDDYTQEECYCNQCDEACFPPDPCLPCRCCLAAEVEALRAQAQEMKQQAHTSVSHALAEERAERAETQVQRVRELLARPRDFRGNGSEWNECRAAVLRALDGDA